MNQSLRVLINLGLIAALLLPVGGIGLAEGRAINSSESGELNLAAPNGSTESTETYSIFLPSVSSANETTTQPPGTFNKISPTNGASDQPTSLILDWGDSNGASSYAHCYDTTNDNACSNWVSTGTTSQATIGGLAYNTTYYWQVRATNATGTTYADGSPTAYWSFTTQENLTQPPGAFNKLAPANGATNQPTDLILDWEDSSGATSYAYCYDQSNDNACSSWTSTGTTSQASLSGLSVDTIYWQVRATNTAGTTYADGSSTAYWSFTTGGGSVTPDGMVFVPAGEFQMGCDPEHNGGFPCYDFEQPLHTVYLDAYYIDTTEVTNAQYAQCVAAGSCALPTDYSSYNRTSYYDNPLYANYPVIYVSWYGAEDYCTWEGKRLPSEAEWEKAARGSSDTRAYPWGDGDPNCTLANSYNSATSMHCVGDTTEVGSYPLGASPYGALDMAGNVWEWVNDWYSDSYYSDSPYENPTGPDSGTIKVLRGGGWGVDWNLLRVADRNGYNPDNRYFSIGFRCAAPQGD